MFQLIMTILIFAIILFILIPFTISYFSKKVHIRLFIVWMISIIFILSVVFTKQTIIEPCKKEVVNNIFISPIYEYRYEGKFKKKKFELFIIVITDNNTYKFRERRHKVDIIITDNKTEISSSKMYAKVWGKKFIITDNYILYINKNDYNKIIPQMNGGQ